MGKTNVFFYFVLHLFAYLCEIPKFSLIVEDV